MWDILPIAWGDFHWHAWSASSADKGVVIANFAGGWFNFKGGTLYNNVGDGLYIGDATTRVNISDAVDIRGNGGFGVNGVTTTLVTAGANPIGNTNGRYAGGVGVENLTASAGFRKHPNGAIHQWGTVAGNAGADTAVVFPIAFPTQISSLSTTVAAVSTATVLESVNTYSIGLSGFTGGPRHADNGGVVGRAGEGWRWEAWGF